MDKNSQPSSDRITSFNYGWLLAAIISLYVLYAGVYAGDSSFEFGGHTWFCLNDDPMISMRYGRNLAQGYGLVFNPGGERVEGYSNLGYVLLMALLHLLPIPEHIISLPIILCGILWVVLLLYLSNNIANLLVGKKSWAGPGASLLVGTSLSLTYWSVSGFEAGLVALFVTYGIWQSLKNLFTKENSCSWIVLFSLGLLMRPDFLLFYILIMGFYISSLPQSTRKVPAMVSVVLLFLLVGGQLIHRLIYFDHFWPCTYYLKMTNFPLHLRLARGIFVTLIYLLILSPILIIGLLNYSRTRNTAPRYALLIPLTFCLALLSNIYVGGDVWEFDNGSTNRFIIYAMPAFYAWIMFCFYGLSRELKLSLLAICGVLIILCTAQNFVGVRFFMQLPITVDYLNSKVQKYEGALLYPLHTRIAKAIQRVTTPEAKIAVNLAGIFPYFADRYCIDMMGKNDYTIARSRGHNLAEVVPGIPFFAAFHPGHTKWSLEHSLLKQQPDIIFYMWFLYSRAELVKFDRETDYIKVIIDLDRHFHQIKQVNYHKMRPFYFLKNSTHIKWDTFKLFQLEPDLYFFSLD
ncbi:hypothetical protein ACFL27_15805 [candidate division CSSED10-310 bacterium]|uniref:Glycosyltransferase RgtA/B/C/D-like domain-containing protein n=1 Tax=candidate division CSSED10-310 bacterium TaxID=2855610 RepID=A0ABV6YZP4_UNCC1